MKELIRIGFSKGMSYQEYKDLMQLCILEEKTTGDEQTKERIEFTKLNASRMKRLDKTIMLTHQDISRFKQTTKQKWLVLSETWCGDAAQTLPILNKIAEITPAIELKIVLRDKNKELMNAFLTDGAQAIPKLILINESNEVLATWGARSKVVTQLVNDYKKQFGSIDAEFKKNLQIWYNKDKGRSIINDLLKITSNVKASTEV